jgi:hypothetical protein
MYCQKCGVQLDDDAQFCKSCGIAMGTAPYPYASAYPQPAKQTNNLALLGLILAFVMPAGGLVVSIIARRQCIERGEDGEKLAKAGIIVGAVNSALLLVLLAAMLSVSFIMLSPAFDAPVIPPFEGLGIV